MKKESLTPFVGKIIPEVFSLWRQYGIIYKSPSVGKDGEEFNALKIQTMWPYMELDASSIRGKKNDEYDKRIAGISGKILRKIRIDELPQIKNIIEGEMSLVGSRPQAITHFDEFNDTQKERYKERKPGLFFTNFGLKHLNRKYNEHELKDLFNRWLSTQKERNIAERLQNYTWILLSSCLWREPPRKKDILKIKSEIYERMEKIGFPIKNLKEDKVS